MIYRLFKVYHTLKEITTIYNKSCSARFHFSSCTFFANNFAHSIFAMLAFADGVANSRFIGCLVALFFLQVLITVYNAASNTKTNADNRTLPFPVNGSPSARFRKRNVTDVGKPTRTRPEASTKRKGRGKPSPFSFGADDRT